MDQPTPPTRQTVVVLEFQRKDTGDKQTIAMPAALPSAQTEFPALLEVINRLDGAATLHDIHPVVTTVAPGKMIELESDAPGLRQTLERQHQRIMDKSHRLPPLDDARAQLQLARFFLDHRCRDAAYLAVENVKQNLAKATQNKALDSATLATLSQELEALESELREKLPFTLGR
jgi:hypothetical protein